jgi:hypothetical protein
MIIALASPRPAATLDEGLDKIKRFQSEASAQGTATGTYRVVFRQTFQMTLTIPEAARFFVWAVQAAKGLRVSRGGLSSPTIWQYVLSSTWSRLALTRAASHSGRAAR